MTTGSERDVLIERLQRLDDVEEVATMKVIALFKRKSGTTFEEFRDYYETRHSVLSLELMPYFSDYRRNYIRHDLGPQRSSAEPPSSRLDFDVLTEISFASHADYDAMLHALGDPAIRDRIVEDEARFIDRSSTLSYVVDEHVSQVGPAATIADGGNQ